MNRVVPRKHADELSRGKIRELNTVASKYLSKKRLLVNNKVSIVGRGRSELSVANDGNPIIDKVSTSGLWISPGSSAADEHPCGVWLCYGFGRYGTMLAPGAARMLVSKMFGKGPNVDDSNFLLTQYVKTNDMGKGKGKAKQ